MTTIDFITELFCRIDDKMADIKKHSQASLYPREVVTIALLFSLKGVGNRAFYRRLKRDYLAWFPKLPCRTRLFRLFNMSKWIDRFIEIRFHLQRLREHINSSGAIARIPYLLSTSI